MLRNRDVIVGKCYVNNTRKVAREIVGIDQKTVRFNTYHLVSGNSCGSHSECTKQEFIRWADREASPAETERLRSWETEALFRAPQESNIGKEHESIQLMQKRATQHQQI